MKGELENKLSTGGNPVDNDNTIVGNKLIDSDFVGSSVIVRNEAIHNSSFGSKGNRVEGIYEDNSTSLRSAQYDDNGDSVILNSIQNLLDNDYTNYNQVIADSNSGSKICYVKGNFNGLIEKTNTGNTNYILAVPGLIVNEKNNSSLDYNTLSGKVVCNGMNNPCIISYTPTVVYEGTGNSVPTTSEDIEDIMDKLIIAYSGSNTSTSTNPAISNLLNSTGSDLVSLGSSLVSKVGVGGNIVVTPSTPTPGIFDSCTATGQTYTGTTTYSDSYGTCDTPDKIVCSGSGVGQVWAMCNVGSTIAYTGFTIPAGSCGSAGFATDCNSSIRSIIGNYYQWGRNDNVTSTTSTSSLASTGTLANNVGHTKFIIKSTTPWDWIIAQNNNLWGGSGTTVNDGTYTSLGNPAEMKGPCADGYHVPTIKEWCDIIKSINNLFNCTSFGTRQTDSFLMINKFKIPFAGLRSYDSKYYWHGTYGDFWTSSSNGINSYAISFKTGNIAISNGSSRGSGFSVRCIKN